MVHLNLASLLVCHPVKEHNILYQWELVFNQRKQLCQLKCLVKGGELVFCIVCQSHLDHLKQLMRRKIESRINFTHRNPRTNTEDRWSTQAIFLLHAICIDKNCPKLGDSYENFVKWKCFVNKEARDSNWPKSFKKIIHLPLTLDPGTWIPGRKAILNSVCLRRQKTVCQQLGLLSASGEEIRGNK